MAASGARRGARRSPGREPRGRVLPVLLALMVTALLLAVSFAPAVAHATDAGPVPEAGEGEGELPPESEVPDEDFGEQGENPDKQGREEEPGPVPAPTQWPVAWGFFKSDDSGNAVVGARIELRNSSGAVLRTFETTGEEAFHADTLNVGEAYTLHEASAPAGLALADDVTFHVRPDGEGGAYAVADGYDDSDAKEEALFLMVDQAFGPLVVDKHGAKGARLAGATLALWDESAKALVERWTSTDEPHVVKSSLLFAGRAYRLVEEEAPEGYGRCGEVSFALDRAGKVTGLSGDAAAYDGASRTLTVTNEAEPEEPIEPKKPTPQEPEDPPATLEPEPVEKTPTPVTEPAAIAEPVSAAEPASSTSDLPQTGEGQSPAGPLAALGLAALGTGAFALVRGICKR